jgi:hypothetical protein
MRQSIHTSKRDNLNGCTTAITIGIIEELTVGGV